jgi:hypothetical protein
MEFAPYLIAVVFVFVIGKLLYGRLRHGSWTGSFLNGSIERTVGEVAISGNFASSQTLKVHAMKGSGSEPEFVAMVLVSKAPLAASMQPIKLTRSQAGVLASLLQDAAR